MNKTTVRNIALVFVGIIFAGLLGWYWFLSSETDDTATLGEARGFGESIPSFSDDSGSTFANIVSGVETNIEEGMGRPPRLWRITASPVAGAGFVGSTTPELYFVERSTGYVFRVDPTISAVRRLTNTLFAKTYEAFVGVSGRALLRGLAESGAITTVSGVASSTEASANSFVSRELPPSIRSIVFSPDAREVFYLIPDGGSGFAGVRAASDGTTPKKIFSTTLSNWQSTWTAGDGIVLTQNAASDVEGSAYTLSDSGVLTPLVRRIEGLSALPDPRSDALLYSSSADGGVSLFAQPAKNGTSIRVSLSTVTDKCVWDPVSPGTAFCAVPTAIQPGAFIDNWYRGAVHTSDSWWKVDARSGAVEELYVGGEPENLPDVSRPTIDPTGSYISFIDSRDTSLWLFRIKN